MSTGSGSRPRPNILLICTDQHRWDVLSVYGNDVVRTPHLQALADAGVVYDHCYSPSPVCAPARASILTGKYPSSHRLWANGVTIPEQPLASRVLADAGYRCGLIGKRHLSACFQGRTEEPVNDGFSYVRWAHDPFHGAAENAYHAWLRAKHPRLWSQAREQVVTPNSRYKHQPTAFDRMPTEAHYSTWVTEETVTFLRDHKRRTEPFFLWVNFYDPHHPFVAPKEYLAAYPPGSVPPPVGGPEELASKPAIQAEASKASYAGAAAGFADHTPEEIDEIRRSYYAMVDLVDDKVGEILAELAYLGLHEDTLVIFTADHGEMLGDHGLLLKGPMMYDAAVRVPLILRWPGIVPAGERRAEMVGLHDLARTILTAADLDPLPGDQGVDLVAVACGAAQGRDYAVAEYRDAGHPYDPPVYTTMYRTPTHKLVVWHGQPATDRAPDGELYDLVADPDECVNQWANPDYQAVKADLLGALLDSVVAREDRSPARLAPW